MARAYSVEFVIEAVRLEHEPFRAPYWGVKVNDVWYKGLTFEEALADAAGALREKEVECKSEG